MFKVAALLIIGCAFVSANRLDSLKNNVVRVNTVIIDDVDIILKNIRKNVIDNKVDVDLLNDVLVRLDKVKDITLTWNAVTRDVVNKVLDDNKNNNDVAVTVLKKTVKICKNIVKDVLNNKVDVQKLRVVAHNVVNLKNVAVNLVRTNIHALKSVVVGTNTAKHVKTVINSTVNNKNIHNVNVVKNLLNVVDWSLNDVVLHVV